VPAEKEGAVDAVVHEALESLADLTSIVPPAIPEE
jgi:hypothetical protein